MAENKQDLLEEAERDFNKLPDSYPFGAYRRKLKMLIDEIKLLRKVILTSDDAVHCKGLYEDLSKKVDQIDSLTKERDELKALIDREKFTGDCHQTAKIKIQDLTEENTELKSRIEEIKELTTRDQDA